MEHVRQQAAGALRIQRGALANTEAMLLVHHRDREGGELDRLLDQRVSADYELGLTRREGVEQLAPLGAGESPR